MAQLLIDLARQAAILESCRHTFRARHGCEPLPELCCRVPGSVGLPVDSGHHVVSSSAVSTGEALVDHKEASSARLSTNANGVRAIDWSEIFRLRPDLSPPGYEEAVLRSKEKVEARKLEPKPKPKAKPSPRSKKKK